MDALVELLMLLGAAKIWEIVGKFEVRWGERGCIIAIIIPAVVLGTVSALAWGLEFFFAAVIATWICVEAYLIKKIWRKHGWTIVILLWVFVAYPVVVVAVLYFAWTEIEDLSFVIFIYGPIGATVIVGSILTPFVIRYLVNPWLTPIRYKKGQQVRHPIFGQGTVVKSEIERGAGIVTVAFESGSTKRLHSGVARFEKLEK